MPLTNLMEGYIIKEPKLLLLIPEAQNEEDE